MHTHKCLNPIAGANRRREEEIGARRPGAQAGIRRQERLRAWEGASRQGLMSSGQLARPATRSITLLQGDSRGASQAVFPQVPSRQAVCGVCPS